MSVEIYEVKVFSDGTRFWYQNHNLHRLNEPAIEWANGTIEWWIEGRRHRLNGPAIEHADGTKLWYLNNQLHRLDGPAIENAEGGKFWYIDGKEVPEPKSEPISCNGKIVEIDGRKYELKEV